MLHYIKTNKINNEQDASDVFVVVGRVVDFFHHGLWGWGLLICVGVLKK